MFVTPREIHRMRTKALIYRKAATKNVKAASIIDHPIAEKHGTRVC